MSIKFASFAAAALFACNAQAATVSVSNITAEWFGAVGGKKVKIVNSRTGAEASTIKWGKPAGSGKSGYDFAPSTPGPVTAGLDESFILGEFAHNNFVIYAGGAITAVDLKLTFDVGVTDDLGGKQALSGVTSVINFTHLETNNDAKPCEAGGEGKCPDLVTVKNSSAMADKITLNGVEYSLFITGFEGGNANADGSLSFLTLEDQRNTAGLKAIMTANGKPPVSAVPVPAALPLMLSAFSGLGFLSLRRKRNG